jgi:voltage-gated potassium channel
MNVKKVITWGGVIFGFISLATIGYMLILKVSFIDALYMTVITISTVGYKEVVELNALGKIFTMGVIFTSVGTIGYLLSVVFRFFSEANINEAWRKKKMMKEIGNMTNHIIVCGAGETGVHVIKQLKRRMADFVVIENDPEALELLKELEVKYIFDDATKEETLMNANIKSAKGLISTLAKDADNAFVVMTARELNPGLNIVSRAHGDSSHKKLKRAGADKTVSPDEIGGKKMAALMISPDVQYFVDNIIDTKNMSINMEEVIIEKPSQLIDTKLRDAKISEQAGLIVLAIRRGVEDDFIFNPKADETLHLHDKMIVVGSKEQISMLKKMAKDVE